MDTTLPHYRPSSLPMLRQCPAFTSKQGERSDSDCIDEGKWRHNIVQACLNCGDKTPLELLPDDPVIKDQCSWALDYIYCNSSEGDTLYTEHSLKAVACGKWDVSGTADIIYVNSLNGVNLFDIKSRRRNYLQQLAAYALGCFREFNCKYVKAHIAYLVGKQSEMIRFESPEECEEIIEATLLAASEPVPFRTQCDYCRWCSKMSDCPEWTDKVSEAAKMIDGAVLPDFSGIRTNPVDILKSFVLAKQMKKWAAEIEDEVHDRLSADPKCVPGLELATRKKSYTLKDTPLHSVFSAAGIPQDLFFRACNARFNKTKSSTGLVEIYAKLNGITLKDAAKQLKIKFASFVPDPGTTTCIIVKSTNSDETDSDNQSEGE